jgi:hypothetical protein
MKPNAKDIREALRNNCLYVYVPGDKCHRRIIDAKERHGRVYGQLLNTGQWVEVKSWFQG